MKDMKIGLVIDARGNLIPQSKRYTDAINKFSRSGRRDMQALDNSAIRVRRNFDQLGTRLGAVATGAGAAALIARVGQMERRMTRLGIAANQSTDEISALQKQVYAEAGSVDIRVDSDKIVGALETILEMTGDFEFAKDQIRNIGIALQATGADSLAVGGMFAEFQKAGIKAPQAVAEAIDTLNVQGKEGAFTLAEFARMGPRLYSAYAAVGRVGQTASREIGAVAQVVRGATGSSEQATTSIEALLRVFSDAKKIEGFNKAGINIFDVEELKKGREVLRPINDLMADIVKKTKGKATLIQSLVGSEEAGRAFGNLIKEYNQTGDVKSLERFMQMMGDGTTTLKDSQRAAKDSAAAMDDLYNSLRQFSDEMLTGPIGFVADQLKSLLDDYREFKGFAGQIVDSVSNVASQVVTAPEAGTVRQDYSKQSVTGTVRQDYSKQSVTGSTRRDYSSSIVNKIPTANAVPQTANVGGIVKIQVEGPARVKSVQSNNPSVPLNVDAGLTMAGAR